MAGLGILAAVAAAVVMLRKPAADGNTEALFSESVAAEALEINTDNGNGTETGSSPGGRVGLSGSLETIPQGTDVGAEISDVQETKETFETEIVAVVDIYEKAVEALAEESFEDSVSGFVPEVVMEKIVIEDIDDSGDDGRPGTKEQKESSQDNGNTAASGETEKQSEQTASEPESTAPSKEPESTAPSKEPESTAPSKEPESTAPSKEPESTAPSKEPESTAPSKEPESSRDGQKEPEPESISQTESSADESEISENSTESTEAETETTTVPVVQRKELVLGSESIVVPMEAPESIQEFNKLPGESKYSLALEFDSVAKYNEYLTLLQKAADKARIEAGGDATVN